MRILFVLTLIIGAALSNTAPAAGTCNSTFSDKEMELLAGPYVLDIGPALMLGDGKFVWLKTSSRDLVRIVFHDGQLYMVSAKDLELDGGKPILLSIVDEFPDKVAENLSAMLEGVFDERLQGYLERVLDCELDDMVHLVGSDTTTSEEGIPIGFRYSLVIIGHSQAQTFMIGLLEWKSEDVGMHAQIHQIRAVTLLDAKIDF